MLRCRHLSWSILQFITHNLISTINYNLFYFALFSLQPHSPILFPLYTLLDVIDVCPKCMHHSKIPSTMFLCLYIHFWFIYQKCPALELVVFLIPLNSMLSLVLALLRVHWVHGFNTASFIFASLVPLVRGTWLSPTLSTRKSDALNVQIYIFHKLVLTCFFPRQMPIISAVDVLVIWFVTSGGSYGPWGSVSCRWPGFMHSFLLFWAPIKTSNLWGHLVNVSG